MADVNLEMLNYSVDAVVRKWHEFTTIGYADPRNTKSIIDSIVSALIDLQALMNDLVGKQSAVTQGEGTVERSLTNRGPVGA